jgi:AcrR family transcriptional regulator
MLAQHGPEAVSLRQIAAEAGYASSAPIQYHFGSKDGLIKAINDLRQPGIDARRIEILDRAGEISLPAIAESMTLPFLDADVPADYVALTGRLLATYGKYATTHRAANDMPGWRRTRNALDLLLADVPPNVRALRLNFANVLLLNAIAERRTGAGLNTGALRLSAATFTSELLKSVVALLAP